jgi:hypothetical protein
MNVRLRFWLIAAVVVISATTLRGLWLTADPATTGTVGVVWHDEGAWTHNARNQVLVGAWRTDEWNPVFIAPVFTALEYVAFDTFGVGTWQARLVPLISGLLAVLALMLGLSVVAGRRAAVVGGLLLATNYTFVMWNRAALMESTMTAFIVISWAAYAAATTSTRRSAVWGVLAGAAAVAAFFTKAAAAFFIAALVMEAATAWWLSRGLKPSGSIPQPPSSIPQLAILVGLCAATAVALAVLVVPYWTEFQFYNWEMTVTRKPSYGLGDFVQRASWLPVVHGTFTRMWLVLVVAAIATLSVIARWRTAPPAARLAVLWVLVGLAELIVHDSGNERRYVMFVPALIALASLQMASVGRADLGRWRETIVLPAAAVLLTYLVAGSLLRLLWIDEVLAGELKRTVRLSAGLAVIVGATLWWTRAHAGAWLGHWRVPTAAAIAMVVVTVATDLTLYAQWARSRTFLNYEASRLVGTLLPPGTLVHGKLANGLSLENQIAPVFVGQGFGNYADRLTRDDARYILSYTLPRPGYEGEVILDVLQQYPQRRVVTEFDVQETPGPDRAALIQKLPDGPDPRARDK